MRNELEALNKPKKVPVELVPVVEENEPIKVERKEEPKKEADPIPQQSIRTPPIPIPKIGRYATRSRWAKYT